MDFGDVKRGMDPYADAEATQRHFQEVGKASQFVAINQTDLLAGTSQQLIAPFDGKISKLTATVQAAVTTGGPITVKVNGVTVVGLSVTVADGATAGTRYTDTPTGDGTEVVAAGDKVEIVPDGAFATAGAVNCLLEFSRG